MLRTLKTKWRIKPLYLRVVASVFVLFLITRFVDVRTISDMIQSTNPFYIVVVLLFITLDRIVMAAKWNVLLRARGVVIPTRDLIRTYYISNFVGFFLPATVGVDGMRLWHLSKHRSNLSKIAASIVIERLFGLIVLSLFAFPAILLSMFFVDADLSRIVWLNLFVLIALSGAFALSISRFGHSLFRSRLVFLTDKSWFKKLQEFYESYREYRQSARGLVIFSLMTVAELTIPILANYYVAVALNIRISFLYFVGIIPIILFLSRIPLPFDVIGVQEGLYVVMFSLVGVGTSQAFSMGLLQHLLVLVGMLPGCVFYLMEPIKAKKVPV
ncbi:MAG: lysylphosphatidylglycerol synthase transmembrane domain-containing protein [Nitrolancea sp.]